MNFVTIGMIGFLGAIAMGILVPDTSQKIKAFIAAVVALLIVLVAFGYFPRVVDETPSEAEK